jgi:hypothetical protein
LRLRHAVIPIAVLSAVPLAGCGTKTLDTSQIETQLKTKLAGNAPLKSVDCPSSVDAKKGGKFTCTATAASGNKYTVNVTQTDDNGHVTAQVAGPAK